MKIIVSKENYEVSIGDNRPIVLIGERINPTGKKKPAEALKCLMADSLWVWRENSFAIPLHTLPIPQAARAIPF